MMERLDKDEIVAKAVKVYGWTNKKQLKCLAELAEGKRLVVEIGSYKGRSTVVLAAVAKRVYAVDTHSGYVAKASKYIARYTFPEFWGVIKEFGLEKRVVPIVMESLRVSWGKNKG